VLLLRIRVGGLGLFLLSFIFSILPVPAAEVLSATQLNDAQSDVAMLIGQWRQANPAETFTPASLHRFASLQYATKQTMAQSPPIVPAGSVYQPLYVLGHGGWVMGFIEEGSGQVGAVVDVNGGLPPNRYSATAANDLRIFVFNTAGQMVQIIN
jgi:hypothetical protein